MTGNIDIRRFAAEGATIVVSILLAFWIDAWWGAKQQDNDERLLLIAVYDELLGNREHLAAKTAFHEAVRDAIRDLLSEAALPAPSVGENGVDALLGNASWFGASSTFEMSAVDAVVFGGSLSVIENPALRKGITGWEQDVEILERIEAQDYDSFAGVWLPFLRGNADLVQIHNAILTQPGSEEDDYMPALPAGPHAMSHSVLFQNREFQNVLVHRLWVQGDILYQYDRIRPSFDALIAMLEAELEK